MKRAGRPVPASRPPWTGPWLIHLFQRQRSADARESVPARDHLDSCPVAARLLAVVKAVADAPPPAFSGGGKWEAMHGLMAGLYEARVDGPSRGRIPDARTAQRQPVTPLAA